MQDIKLLLFWIIQVLHSIRNEIYLYSRLFYCRDSYSFTSFLSHVHLKLLATKMVLIYKTDNVRQIILTNIYWSLDHIGNYDVTKDYINTQSVKVWWRWYNNANIWMVENNIWYPNQRNKIKWRSITCSHIWHIDIFIFQT